MKQDFERLAPAVDWCTPAAYENPIPSETLGEIDREIARFVAAASHPAARAHEMPEIPGYFWFILFAVMVVTLL